MNKHFIEHKKFYVWIISKKIQVHTWIKLKTIQNLKVVFYKEIEISKRIQGNVKMEL